MTMHASVRQRPSYGAQGLARAYYLVAGLIGVAIPTIAVAGALTSGCSIALSQMDVAQPPARLAPEAATGCTTYVDPFINLIAVVVGVVLLATAWRFGDHEPAPRAVVTLGALVGIGAAYLPAALIWFFVTHHRETPIGIAEIALAASPFLVPLAAAWVTWRTHRV